MAITVNTELQLSQADSQFISLVNNRITVYGQIPYTVPRPLIIDVIKESARLFYKTYYRATTRKFYFIDKNDIIDGVNTGAVRQSGLANYEITLAPYISVVQEVWESGRISLTTSQQLLENVQLLQRTAPYGQSVLGINNNLYIIEAAVRMVEESNYNSIFSTTVPFKFNQLTKLLNIRKEITSNLLLEVLANIDIQFLYNDNLFIKHVIGRTKQELKRVIAGHTIELPGGATLNADEICANANEDVEKCEEELKAGGGIGDLIMTR